MASTLSFVSTEKLASAGFSPVQAAVNLYRAVSGLPWENYFEFNPAEFGLEVTKEAMGQTYYHNCGLFPLVAANGQSSESCWGSVIYSSKPFRLVRTKGKSMEKHVVSITSFAPVRIQYDENYSVEIYTNATGVGISMEAFVQAMLQVGRNCKPGAFLTFFIERESVTEIRGDSWRLALAAAVWGCPAAGYTGTFSGSFTIPATDWENKLTLARDANRGQKLFYLTGQPIVAAGNETGNIAQLCMTDGTMISKNGYDQKTWEQAIMFPIDGFSAIGVQISYKDTTMWPGMQFAYQMFTFCGRIANLNALQGRTVSYEMQNEQAYFDKDPEAKHAEFYSLLGESVQQLQEGYVPNSDQFSQAIANWYNASNKNAKADINKKTLGDLAAKAIAAWDRGDVVSAAKSTVNFWNMVIGKGDDDLRRQEYVPELKDAAKYRTTNVSANFAMPKIRSEKVAQAPPAKKSKVGSAMNSDKQAELLAKLKARRTETGQVITKANDQVVPMQQ